MIQPSLIGKRWHFKERIKSEMMVIKSLGVVYGDIGTSPIYTLAVVLLLIKPTPDSIFQI